MLRCWDVVFAVTKGDSRLEVVHVKSKTKKTAIQIARPRLESRLGHRNIMFHKIDEAVG